MSKLRIDLTDVPFHVFARGNNKQDIFFDEIDRLVFLKYCREAKEQFDFRLFTYALMNNHFHLLLQMEKESSLAQLMQGIQFQYARYINRKFRRVGHLFDRRGTVGIIGVTVQHSAQVFKDKEIRQLLSRRMACTAGPRKIDGA